MDDETELQEIRRRKLEALQQNQAQEEVQAQVDQQADQQRQAILRQILTQEARERLARLRIARAEFAEAVEDQLIMLAQSGQLRAIIDDANLVQILERLTPEKRDITIKRK
ncbi:MAG: DNA-binding protein [Candidatus Thermoplasmatota archaeon]|nr:DNA-binding protein [Euryarchaeota archaeon]MBU4032760.1 DNA-binding protein [Candidatus Thermoplasmatota archaeon]MBU4070850.1 DNA-binding protein [Candidatus Thermoplasmatota archaeon]MBU4143417.1 DNA-binding protein [Candidatus Thermoplasmatota archaeon]MBU4592446.1 DNA-binding protein [Candidatus Thermoplasmatota archaeon]